MHSEELLEEIRTLPMEGYDEHHPFRIMEVCGTHTMSIARSGLKQLLPPWVQLVSGPGCPVCVTPAGAIDEVLRIAEIPNVTIVSYGDLLRVPGSMRGSSLLRWSGKGCDVRIVYSPMDALDIADAEPERQVVFLGVGFETTAPGTAATILSAEERGITNFTVLSLLKKTEPVIRRLLDQPETRLNGLLCPGHVATILGSNAFDFLPKEYGVPAVVAGFETEEVVEGVAHLCRLGREGRAELVNAYPRFVRSGGNPVAQQIMNTVFEQANDIWRGFGGIEGSGMRIRERYAGFDASRRFGFDPADREENSGCCCGSVLQGLCSPQMCPLFAKVCTPADPVGPCMVSGEGACAAAYHYLT